MRNEVCLLMFLKRSVRGKIKLTLKTFSKVCYKQVRFMKAAVRNHRLIDLSGSIILPAQSQKILTPSRLNTPRVNKESTRFLVTRLSTAGVGPHIPRQ